MLAVRGAYLTNLGRIQHHKLRLTNSMKVVTRVLWFQLIFVFALTHKGLKYAGL